MATSQNIDGLILTYNYRFLVDFSREKFDITDIRIKFTKPGRESSYRTYANIQTLYEAFRTILSATDFQCYVGMYGIIESCKINNLSLNFENQYTVKTISSLIQVQKNFKYDSYRNKFNSSQVENYDKYIYKKFTMYKADVDTILQYRNSTYIDPCWIDPDYFDGDTLKLVKF